MGSRGARSNAGWSGGGNENPGIQSTTSLVSERERKQKEVDDTLAVLRDIYEEYGVNVADVQLATMTNNLVMAYYDSGDNLAVNNTYFDDKKMAKAYATAVKEGYHPNNGNKTAMQAVVAHELGHTLTARAAGGFENINRFSDKIVTEAARTQRYKNPASFASKISGYARSSPAEAIAEAYSDVYCNGNKANSSSRAIVDTLNKYLKGGKK